jgi:osmotically-inducible protein OsmY
MKGTLLMLLLAFATMLFAKQQASSLPGTTPPTFPQGQAGQAPARAMPPDKEAPPPRQNASADVQQQIQDKLDAEPALRRQNVKANATETAVLLSGTVDTEQQHRMAVAIAQSYAGTREVMDRIEVQGRK